MKKSRSDLGERRGRLIPPEDRALAVQLIEEAVRAGARTFKACDSLEIGIRTYQRWKANPYGDRRKAAERKVARKLRPDERDYVVQVCCRDEYANVTPYAIYADLLNEVLNETRNAHPERWPNGQSQWKEDPVVYLNPDPETRETLLKKTA